MPEYPEDTSYEAYLRWAEQHVTPAGGLPFSREEYPAVLADLQRKRQGRADG